MTTQVKAPAKSGAPQGATAVVRTVDDLRAHVAAWHGQGLRVGLVPTMGALHHGHLSLIDRLADHVDRVIVSIFVNPAQFGPNEDFSAYPRREAQDLAALETVGADLAYLPDVKVMYPQGFRTNIHVKGLSEGLEGDVRPGHFDGVATVVMKLLMQSQCDCAIFGEKDFQQFAVLRRLVIDLDLPVEIVAGPIIREPDGLAASSRNVYLNAEQRSIAGQFNLVLADLRRRAMAGEDLRILEQEGEKALLAKGFDRVDYVRFCNAESLEMAEDLTAPVQLLAVAVLGKTRLLDNVQIG
ncbi:pantothenate synthetase [Iodidimonas gelatinilytica]|uniref:Pantothenate synthetase n=1 Tax=Iodidimonas gelatinilytica TaxID=1236966 RepID=A0A5A7MUV3_9PROT|nr:pantoate--beta-alanine ligase [Iodidimonas gelatinilytica]GEQ98828.1 pantothenate synthetase [Iodidimonas gelatinilytica]